MTGSHIHFVESQDHHSPARNYVQVATPKSPNSDSAWSDSEEPFTTTSASGSGLANNNNNSLDSTLKRKLVDQIDLEILLKHREYKLIENEITKVQEIMKTLEQLHDDEKYGEYMTQLILLKRKANGLIINDQTHHHNHHNNHHNHHSNHHHNNSIVDPLSNYSGLTITKSSLRPSSTSNSQHNSYYSNNSTNGGTNTTGNIPHIQAGSGPGSVTKNDHRTSYGGIPSLVLPNGSKICIHRLANGKLVKISCPVCSRADFGSAQGFLNHARLLHQLEFKSQGDVATKCGVELDPWETELWNTQQLQSNNSNYTNVDINGGENNGTKKRQRINSSSNIAGNNGSVSIEKNKVKYLTKVVNENKDINEKFEELVKDVTTKDQIDFDNDLEEAESPGGTTTMSNVGSIASVVSNGDGSLVKGHNRRKSRGGLSAVKFEDEINDNDTIIGAISDADATINTTNSINGIDEIIDESKLTPAQRRRVPSIPNPLRTRSRSSRENSR